MEDVEAPSATSPTATGVGSADSLSATTFNVGDMVMIQEADGQLQERQVVEVSSKTVNRRKRLYYKLQSADTVSRKRGRVMEEWHEGENVRRHDPQALAVSAAKLSGMRRRRGTGVEKEEAGGEGKEDRKSSPGRVTRSGGSGEGGGGGGDEVMSDPLLMWEYVKEALSDPSMKGGNLADIQAYIQAKHGHSARQTRKCLNTAIEKAVSDKRIEKLGRHYRIRVGNEFKPSAFKVATSEAIRGVEGALKMKEVEEQQHQQQDQQQQQYDEKSHQQHLQVQRMDHVPEGRPGKIMGGADPLAPEEGGAIDMSRSTSTSGGTAAADIAGTSSSSTTVAPFDAHPPPPATDPSSAAAEAGVAAANGAGAAAAYGHYSPSQYAAHYAAIAQHTQQQHQQQHQQQQHQQQHYHYPGYGTYSYPSPYASYPYSTAAAPSGTDPGAGAGAAAAAAASATAYGYHPSYAHPAYGGFAGSYPGGSYVHPAYGYNAGYSPYTTSAISAEAYSNYYYQQQQQQQQAAAAAAAAAASATTTREQQYKQSAGDRRQQQESFSSLTAPSPPHLTVPASSRAASSEEKGRGGEGGCGDIQTGSPRGGAMTSLAAALGEGSVEEMDARGREGGKGRDNRSLELKMFDGANVGALNQLARENEARLAKRREREKVQRQEKKAKQKKAIQSSVMSAAAIGALRGGTEAEEEEEQQQQQRKEGEGEEGWDGTSSSVALPVPPFIPGRLVSTEEAWEAEEKRQSVVRDDSNLSGDKGRVEQEPRKQERKEAKARYGGGHRQSTEEGERDPESKKRKAVTGVAAGAMVTDEASTAVLGIGTDEGSGGGGGKKRSTTPTALSVSSPRSASGGGGKKKPLISSEEKMSLTDAQRAEKMEEIKKWENEFRKAKKGFAEIQEVVMELRQAREKEAAELNDLKRRWLQSQTRFANYHRLKEESLLPDVKDDLDVIVAEARKKKGQAAAVAGGSGGGGGGLRVASAAPGGLLSVTPPSFILSTPRLPSRTVPDLLEVTHFVRQLAKPLSVEAFPLIHLLRALTEGDEITEGVEGEGRREGNSCVLMREFSEVPAPLPPFSTRGGPKSLDVGAPPPFFLSRCFLSFVRLIFNRNVATGEAREGEEGGPRSGRGEPKESSIYLWNQTRFCWAELLNPLTLPEIIRRYLVARIRERKACLGGGEEGGRREGGKDVLEFFETEGGFCPFGEGYVESDNLVESAVEALRCMSLERLGGEHSLALLRVLMEEVQDLKGVQEWIQGKVERLLLLTEAKNEVEKELRKANREQKKVVTAAKLIMVEDQQQAVKTAATAATADATTEGGEEKDSASSAAPAASSLTVTDEDNDSGAIGVAAGTGGDYTETPQIQALNLKIQKLSIQLDKAKEELEEFEREFARVRTLPLGEDRYRNQYWYFENEPRLYVHLRSGGGGGEGGGEGGVVGGGTGLVLPFRSGKILEAPPSRPRGGEWGIYTTEEGVRRLIGCLCVKGWREGQLLKALEGVMEPLVAAMRRGAGYRDLTRVGGEEEGTTASASSTSLVSQEKEPKEGPKEEVESWGIAQMADEGEEGAAAAAGAGTGAAAELSGVKEDGGGGISMDMDGGEGGKEEGVWLERSDSGGNNSSSTAEEPRRSQRSRKPASTFQIGALFEDGGGGEEGGRTRREGVVSRYQRGGGKEMIANVPRPAYRLAFEATADVMGSLKNEMIDVEGKVWAEVEGSTLAEMIPLGQAEARARWREGVKAAGEWTELAGPLVTLEEMIGQCLGVGMKVDEAIRLFDLLTEEELAKKIEAGRKGFVRRKRGRPKGVGVGTPSGLPAGAAAAAAAMGDGGDDGAEEGASMVVVEGGGGIEGVAEGGEGENVEGEGGDEEEEEEEGDEEEEEEEEDDMLPSGPGGGARGGMESEPASGRNSEEEDEDEDEDEDEEEEEEEDEEEDEEDEEEEEEGEEDEEEEEGEGRKEKGETLVTGDAGSETASSLATDRVQEGVVAKRGGGRKPRVYRPVSRTTASNPSRHRGRRSSGSNAVMGLVGLNGLPLRPKRRRRRRRRNRKDADMYETDEEDFEKERKPKLKTPEALAADAELAIINGALNVLEPQMREAWREEVRQALTPSGLALCFYAFVRRTYIVLPDIKRRVRAVKQQEINAKNSILSNVEAGALNLPTHELPVVIWARLPRGPYWPALAHRPHHAGLRKLLKAMGHRMIRFVGETGVYHLRTEVGLIEGLAPPAVGGNAASVLSFVDKDGKSTVDVLKKGRSLAKALKVAWELHRKFEEEGRVEVEGEEEVVVVPEGGVEEWLGDLREEEDEEEEGGGEEEDEVTESEEEGGRSGGRRSLRKRKGVRREPGSSGREEGGGGRRRRRKL